MCFTAGRWKLRPLGVLFTRVLVWNPPSMEIYAAAHRAWNNPHYGERGKTKTTVPGPFLMRNGRWAATCRLATLNGIIHYKSAAEIRGPVSVSLANSCQIFPHEKCVVWAYPKIQKRFIHFHRRVLWACSMQRGEEPSPCHLPTALY